MLHLLAKHTEQTSQALRSSSNYMDLCYYYYLASSPGPFPAFQCCTPKCLACKAENGSWSGGCNYGLCRINDCILYDSAFNSSTPTVTDYQKVPWCSRCNSSDHELRDVPLADRSYSIWLHSFRYTSDEPSDPWTFEAPRPTWTNLSAS